jgi:hypothetical protein
MDPAVVTLATSSAFRDLKVFLTTLDLFNAIKPKVYLLCDTALKERVTATKIYSGEIIFSTGLNSYTGKTRLIMERTPGQIYKTEWEDFMMEKATVLDLAYAAGEQRVFFFDSDICFMGPLPTVPATAKLGLSRHMIRPADEARFGTYNAGFVYTADSTIPHKWREASKHSRYYDQAALEDLDKHYGAADAVHYFPIQNNYGWWRMFQGTESPQANAADWSINRIVGTAGLCVSKLPLLSIHTHWGEAHDLATANFNRFVYGTLHKLKSHPPAATLRRFLDAEFPHLR